MTAEKAVLFDLDGTLLDTAPEFAYCLNHLLQEEGKSPVVLAELREFVSFGAKGMVGFAFKLSEQDPAFNDLKERFLALYYQNTGFQSQLFPGVSTLLQQITDKEIPWGIVTNKQQVYTTRLIEKFKPLQAALCVVAGDTLSVNKPDPAPLLHACQTLKVKPEKCWYIGDAKTDVEASKSAKMRCGVAQYGYIPRHEDAKHWQADYYLEKISDIEHFLFA